MKRLTLAGFPCPVAFFVLLFSPLSAQSQPLVVPLSNAPFCAGSADLNLNETGGDAASWQWSGPNGFHSTIQNPVILQPGASSSGLYSVTVTNSAGITNSASILVKIHAPGALICNDQVQISLDGDGVVPVTPLMILEGNYPDPEFYSVTITKSNGQSLGNTVTCAEIGQNLTVKITDTCGGNSCWGNLKVEDKLPPKVTCPTIEIPCAVPDYSPSYLYNKLGIQAAYPGVVENCSYYIQSYFDVFYNQDCPESVNFLTDYSAFVSRKWTVTDSRGNSASCLQTIKLRRMHIPDVQLPPDVTVSCSNPNTDPSVTGAPFISFNGVIFKLYPSAAFCEINSAYTDQIVPVCDGTHKIIRDWLVIDGCVPTMDIPMNPLEFKQIIRIMDVTGPSMKCPEDITVGTDPFQCCATITLPTIRLSDNCSRVNSLKSLIYAFQPDSTYSLMYTVGASLTDFPGNNLWNPDTLGRPDPTPCLPVNEYRISYQAKDDCDNTSQCTFHLTVEDQTPPTVACDTYTTVALTTSGTAEVFAQTFDDGSFDYCCLDHFEARRMNGDCQGKPDDFGPTVLFCCTDIGDTVQVIMRAFDCHGRYNDCMVEVYVQDKIKPTCTPPANVTVSCENFDPSLWAYGKASAADNCCIDTVITTANYSLFDTVCNVGTIVRIFRAYDCSGLSSQCTQSVVVLYKQDYYIKMPNDAIVYKCDGTGNFGVPSFNMIGCELIGVSYEDEVFTVVPDACYKIERSWKIINWCTYKPNSPCIDVPNPNPSPNATDPNNIRGPVIAPAQASGAWTPTVIPLTPNDITPTNFSTFYDPNANCYTYHQIIKIIDAQDPVVHAPAGPVQLCDLTANDPALWNEAGWWDSVTSSHDLCEGPADLNITAIDSCEGTKLNVRYLLYLDLDGDGKMETVVNSNNPPDPGTVLYNNAADPNFLIGTVRTFDERNVPVNQKYRFTFQASVVNKLLSISLRWNTLASPDQYVVPELPYGNHKIKWIVEDGCGNETIREYPFTVKDCKKPTVVCLNGLSVNIMPNGMITLWGSDFLQYAQDNCTPSNQLKVGIRRSGTGAGFPLDASGAPQTSVTFNCGDLGTQPVELWAMDAAGNADYCQTYVLVQDNMAFCPSVNGKVAGVLATEMAEGLEQGNILAEGGSNTVPAFSYQAQSDHNGAYNFNAVPLSSDMTITPSKDDNPLNGVTTYDLVLISKHILGVQPLKSPYKMIAADANKSGSITTADIVELRKLILGQYSVLPDNTSWRFIDGSFAFPNNSNPFQSGFPEKKLLTGFQGNSIAENFVAVKVGDVNGSAITSALTHADSRSMKDLIFHAENRNVRAGEEVAVLFQPDSAALGFQFTLRYEGLEITELIPHAGMTSEQFAIFPEAGALTSSWFRQSAEASPSFTVRFHVLRDGALSAMLHLSSSITSMEAYDPAGDLLHPVLQWSGSAATADYFELYQNEPNPFSQQTTIGFRLPEPETATLTVFDALGRTLYRHSTDYPAGDQHITLNRQNLDTPPGVLYYKLETPANAATKKMMLSGK